MDLYFRFGKIFFFKTKSAVINFLFSLKADRDRRPNAIPPQQKPRPTRPTTKTTTPAYSPNLDHDSENDEFDWNALKRPQNRPPSINKITTTTPSNSPNLEHDSENDNFDWDAVNQRRGII